MLLQTPLAEGVIEEKLHERLRAQRARLRRVPAHDETRHRLHHVVNLGQERTSREHGAHERKRRGALLFALFPLQIAEGAVDDEPKLRVRGGEGGVALQQVVEQFQTILRQLRVGRGTLAE